MEFPAYWANTSLFIYIYFFFVTPSPQTSHSSDSSSETLSHINGHHSDTWSSSSKTKSSLHQVPKKIKVSWIKWVKFVWRDIVHFNKPYVND